MVNTGGNVQLEAHSGNFTIDADNVGIGTTGPGGKLDIFDNFKEVINLKFLKIRQPEPLFTKIE